MQSNITRRIAVIEDLSCIGRCSLGVAMSVLPVMGVETAVLPTAILSAHTAFKDFTFMDFTSEARKIMLHWKAMNLRFDAIYIGYLGSLQLIDLAEDFIRWFHDAQTQVILDPAFGDHGRLYTGFDQAYVEGMRRLCRHAQIILPNVTEACFLTGTPYGESPQHSAQLSRRCEEMLGESLQNILLTSCCFPNRETGLICVGRNAFHYSHEQLSLACHGTGDLFASVFSGLMLRSAQVERSARTAADFTFDCIRYSMTCSDHRWYGVDYEAMLPELARRIAEF